MRVVWRWHNGPFICIIAFTPGRHHLEGDDLRDDPLERATREALLTGRALGVQSSPTFVQAERIVAAGAQPPEILAEAIAARLGSTGCWPIEPLASSPFVTGNASRRPRSSAPALGHRGKSSSRSTKCSPRRAIEAWRCGARGVSHGIES